VLAWLGCKAFPQRLAVALLSLLAYGALIEVLQAFTPSHVASGLDLLADGLGLLLGWGWHGLRVRPAMTTFVARNDNYQAVIADSIRNPWQATYSLSKEKLSEALLSREEMACAEDHGDYFRIPPDGRDLNYAKFVGQGEQRITQSAHGEDYNSHNTTRLDVAGMKALLLKLDFMQRIARGERVVAEE